ncbi:hypothetical protein [Amycolatopsis thermoflava]|uniref:hypothetical protein n=1 Tax=Amycolatopsis thermoflava TaxID=84480 RepID=UPI0038122212
MADDLFLVFSNPVPGRADEYNDWYDQRHLGDVLAVPGVTAARRYSLAPAALPEAEDMPAPPPAAHSYLAVYELDGEPDEVMAEFLRWVGSGEMPLSDSLDLASIAMTTWRARGPRRHTDD